MRCCGADNVVCWIMCLSLQGPITVEDHPHDYCGDCYGADTPELR